ncbi:MAG TPA: hypothetical protein VLB74_06970 [Flavobacterium sp.]|nr:hypothetical protein [Flavobacterium sp.]HSD14373.1 hypothetical protein [Flavobacterium sp.]
MSIYRKGLFIYSTSAQMEWFENTPTPYSHQDFEYIYEFAVIVPKMT